MKSSFPPFFKPLFDRWQSQPLLAWPLAIGWVLLVCWVAFWLYLGGIGLVDETEPLFAEASRQMVETGDWITPYFNGETRFDKPPLVYWLMAIAYKVAGVNEWSVRFPSALAATLLALMGLYTLRFLGFPRPKLQQTLGKSQAHPSPANTEISPSAVSVPAELWLSAILGSTLMALNPQTIVWARTGVSDMLLSGCMGIGLLGFFWGYSQPLGSPGKTRGYLAFYIFSALAVLTKGPVGIVLPGLIVVVFLLYLGNFWTVLREMRVVLGTLLFLAINLPWYGLVIWVNGEDYINSFFGYHNFERFTSVVNNHSAPWFFYFLVVPIAFAPWSIHLPVAIVRLRFWQLSHWRQQPRASQLGLFALVWFAVIFVFFSIAVTKLPSYTLPLIPAAAILVGLFWSDQMTRRSPPQAGAQISHWVNILILFILAGATLYSPNWLGNDPEMPDLPVLVQQSSITLWGAGAWTIAGITGLIMMVCRQGRWLWGANLVGLTAFILFTVMPAATFMDAQRQLPLRQLSETIVQVQQPNEAVIMIGFGKPSVVFYTQRPVMYWAKTEQVQARLQDLNQRQPELDSVLMLGRSIRFTDAQLTPNQYEAIDESGVYQLVRISLPFQPEA